MVLKKMINQRQFKKSIKNKFNQSKPNKKIKIKLKQLMLN